MLIATIRDVGSKGKKEFDCPKWTCDRPAEAAYQCDKCAFIGEFIKKRKQNKVKI